MMDLSKTSMLLSLLLQTVVVQFKYAFEEILLLLFVVAVIVVDGGDWLVVISCVRLALNFNPTNSWIV